MFKRISGQKKVRVLNCNLFFVKKGFPSLVEIKIQGEEETRNARGPFLLTCSRLPVFTLTRVILAVFLICCPSSELIEKTQFMKC